MSQDWGTLDYFGAKYEQEMITRWLMFGSTLGKTKCLLQVSKPRIQIVISVSLSLRRIRYLETRIWEQGRSKR